MDEDRRPAVALTDLSMDPLVALPHELSLYILSFLSSPFDLCNALLVSRTWKEFGSEPLLWKKWPLLPSPRPSYAHCPRLSSSNPFDLCRVINWCHRDPEALNRYRLHWGKTRKSFDQKQKEWEAAHAKPRSLRDLLETAKQVAEALSVLNSVIPNNASAPPPGAAESSYHRLLHNCLFLGLASKWAIQSFILLIFFCILFFYTDDASVASRSSYSRLFHLWAFPFALVLPAVLSCINFDLATKKFTKTQHMHRTAFTEILAVPQFLSLGFMLPLSWGLNGLAALLLFLNDLLFIWILMPLLTSNGDSFITRPRHHGDSVAARYFPLDSLYMELTALGFWMIYCFQFAVFSYL